MHKKDIKNLTLEELQKEIAKMSEKPYRAKQIFLWIYKNGIRDFSRIGNISKEFREKLDKNYYIGTIELSKELKSSDGTEKFLFRLQDGNFIESVLIFAKKRKTLCLSTQVGCKFRCSFCASGLRGFVRNLTPSEIVNQILFVQHKLGHKPTNYVFMGMGEPLDNVENVSKAIIIMNTKDGMDIGARRITLSTCGIVPGIEELKKLGLQINLSISLHAGNDSLRNKLLPINKQYPLEKLIRACKDYVGKTKRTITLEYVLMKGVNNSPQDADELADIALRLKAKVNLIPYNPVSNLDFEAPSGDDIDAFMKRLTQKKVNVTFREPKGKDVSAACGQLAGRRGENEI